MSVDLAADVNAALEWCRLQLLDYEYMLALELEALFKREAGAIARRFMQTTDSLVAAATSIEKTSTMVAVYPTVEQQQQLAQPDGQPQETIHCTLAFLGDTTVEQFEALCAVIQNTVGLAEQGTLEGMVGGVASFAGGPDGHPSIVLPDVPGLAELRQKVVDVLLNAGVDVASNHGWTPHLTLDYTETPSPPPEDLLGTPLSFACVSIVRGDVMRFDVPLDGVMTAAAKPTWAIPPAGKVLNVGKLANAVEGTTGRVRTKALTSFTKDLPSCALPGARTASRGLWDRAWVNSLTDDEWEAVRGYRSAQKSWYAKMNGLARGKKIATTQIEETADRIALMDQAIAKSQAPSDLLMYRGIRDVKAATGYLGHELREGDEFRDLGYSSVTRSKRVAADFQADSRRGVVLRVHVPKGTHIAPIDKISSNSKLVWTHEQEHVLPRGTKYRVIKQPEEFQIVRGIGEDSLVVDVEVVDDGYAGAAARASTLRARKAKSVATSQRKAAIRKARGPSTSARTVKTADGRTISVPDPPKFGGNPWYQKAQKKTWYAKWKDKNGVAPYPPGYLNTEQRKAYNARWRKRHGLTASGGPDGSGLGYDNTDPFGGRAGADGVDARSSGESAGRPDGLVAAGGKCGPGEVAMKWDVKSPFYGKTLARTGENITEISRTTQADVMDVIRGSYDKGLSVRDTANALRDSLTGSAQSRAEMIARTEINRLANGASYNAMQVFSDATGVGYHKVWLTAPGAPHPRHELDPGLNGQTVPMDQPFDVNGAQLLYPGDPDGDPGETINCRCTLIFAETGEEIDPDSLLAAAELRSPSNPSGGDTMADAAETFDDSNMPCANCDHAMSAHEGEDGACEMDECSCKAYVSAEGEATIEAVTADGVMAAAQWEAILCPEGKATEDGRVMAPGSISWRELPLSLMAMTETSEGGHVGAELCGRIDSIWKDNGDRMTLVNGSGVFDSGETGAEISRLVGDEILRGNSVDLAIREFTIGKRADYVDEEGFWIGPDSPPEENDVDMLDLLFGDGEDLIFVVWDAVIGMSTVCPFPAFEEATITLVAAGEKGARFRMEGDHLALRMRVYSDGAMRLLVDDSLTASAAGLAPDVPPAEWFEDPEFDGPTALTVTDDGRIFGHAWTWDTCHTSFPNRCVTAPHSHTDYALFHLKEVEVDSGDKLACGTITLDAPHASQAASRKEAMAHYEHTGAAVADVRVGEDEHGGWVVGALRPDASAVSVRKLRGAVLSGDWRGWEGNLELIGLLAVNIPGFPVPRRAEAVVASGREGERVVALLAAGIVMHGGVGEHDKARLLALGARAEGGLAGLAALASSVNGGDCGCES